jgi:hypothetical protein
MGTQAEQQTPAPTSVQTQPNGAAQPTDPDRDESISQTAIAVGLLPEKVKAALIVRRQQNIVTAQIAGTNWGKGLDRDTRRAVADWAARAGIDPATELDVLGGRFYKNAQYYQRKLSEIVEAGKVVYAYVEHVAIDPRLAKIANDSSDPDRQARARKLLQHREDMRIQYNVDDRAKAAAIFHIMLVGVGYEFSAAKWCGGGSRQKDPVGDEFPVETAETRAIRRGMRLIASQNPSLAALVEREGADDDTIDTDIGETLRAGLLQAKKDQIDSAEQFARMNRPLPALPEGNPYGLDMPLNERRPEPVAVEVPKQEPAPAAPSAPVPEFQDDRDLQTAEERALAERKK